MTQITMFRCEQPELWPWPFRIAFSRPVWTYAQMGNVPLSELPVGEPCIVEIPALEALPIFHVCADHDIVILQEMGSGSMRAT